MAIFRFHRGGLKESLETCVLCKNKNELLIFIKDSFGPFNSKVIDESLEIFAYPNEKDCFDSRIGWFTHMVCIELEDIGRHVVGFLSEGFDE